MYVCRLIFNYRVVSSKSFVSFDACLDYAKFLAPLYPGFSVSISRS